MFKFKPEDFWRYSYKICYILAWCQGSRALWTCNPLPNKFQKILRKIKHLNYIFMMWNSSSNAAFPCGEAGACPSYYYSVSRPRGALDFNPAPTNWWPVSIIPVIMVITQNQLDITLGFHTGHGALIPWGPRGLTSPAWRNSLVTLINTLGRVLRIKTVTW